jgi:hypothetical protein
MNQILLGQYEASISMLRATVCACPAAHWESKIAQWPARFVAFHTLYWTDIYLSPDQAAFKSHEFVMEGRGLPFGTPLPEGLIPPGLTQPRTIEYADFCIAKARATLSGESAADLAGPSGFGPTISRAEMHIYNIRHVQHHTGALAAHFRRLTPDLPEGVMDWIDTGTVRTG